MDGCYWPLSHSLFLSHYVSPPLCLFQGLSLTVSGLSGMVQRQPPLMECYYVVSVSIWPEADCTYFPWSCVHLSLTYIVYVCVCAYLYVIYWLELGQQFGHLNTHHWLSTIFAQFIQILQFDTNVYFRRSLWRDVNSFCKETKINLNESATTVISVWIDDDEDETPFHSCFSDNLGWHLLHLGLARLAKLLFLSSKRENRNKIW